MAFTRAWTKQEVEKLYRAIKHAKTHDEILEGSRKAFPKDACTRPAIDWRLRRHGYETISQILFRNKPKIPSPQTVKRDVEEHRLRDELESMRREKDEAIKALVDLEKQVEILKGGQFAKSLKPIVAGKRVGATQRRGTPVLMCSDWHVEERVDPKVVNGLNEYDLEIADRCITKLGENFAWLVKNTNFDCREAIIALLGDLFSNHIHEELVETNFLSPVQVTAWLLPRIERMLRQVAKDLPSVERFIVTCNDGNHGRLTKKIRASTRTANSLEWLLYFNLADRMKDDPRFQFQIADGVWNYVDVYDRTFGFTHGDCYRYLGGVGGLLIPVRRGLNEDRKYRRVDHVSMGHFHTRLDLSDVSVNGSMIGITAYSMQHHYPPEPRQQSFFMIDSEYGKTISAPVILPRTGPDFSKPHVLTASDRR